MGRRAEHPRYVEAVHRLTDRGVVITHAAHGTSQHGFEAEWREIALLAFDGDLVSRCELFDERDLDAALAKFDSSADRHRGWKMQQRGPRPRPCVRRRTRVGGVGINDGTNAVDEDRRRSNAGVRTVATRSNARRADGRRLGRDAQRRPLIATRGDRLASVVSASQL